MNPTSTERLYRTVYNGLRTLAYVTVLTFGAGGKIHCLRAYEVAYVPDCLPDERFGL